MARGKVLVVDDSPLTVAAVKDGLEAVGFAVHVATDLADIPRPLTKHGIELVLLDVEMSEVYGDDLAAILRADEADNGVPIYLLSALEDHELAPLAESAHVDGYIRKRDGVEAVVKCVVGAFGVELSRPPPPRADLLTSFRETAARRIRHARGELAIGDRDHLRRVGYELHALVGEAAVLGHAVFAAHAQDGRHTVARCTETPSAENLAACGAVLDALENELKMLVANLPAHAATHTGGGKRVLLVDDSELYRSTLRAILEDSGYDVSEAASLAEGRQALAAPAFDLVILDVELGDGSGVELIPTVRATLPQAACVVMSGGDSLTLTDRADLVLLKTLDPTSVLVKLQHVMAERSTQS